MVTKEAAGTQPAPQISRKVADALMQIDAKDIVQTVNSLSAHVYSAESQLQLAESNLKRYKELFDDGAVSRAQYDQYLNAYNLAVAGVRQAQAQYTQGANQLDYSVLKAAKTNYVNSLHDYNASKARLDKAVGANL